MRIGKKGNKSVQRNMRLRKWRQWRQRWSAVDRDSTLSTHIALGLDTRDARQGTERGRKTQRGRVSGLPQWVRAA